MASLCFVAFAFTLVTSSAGEMETCSESDGCAQEVMLLQTTLRLDAMTGKDDSCRWSKNGYCEEPEYCAVGTDCTDCSNCGGGGGISTESDSDAISDTEWDFLGGGSAKYSDIQQGYLGDCYFLATLSSIAFTHPELIKNMFTKGSLVEGAHPVYTTKWLLNGKPTALAVNNMIPADPNTGLPYFVQEKGGNYWPLVLEKAWAKLFGGYKSIEGGNQNEVIKAMTQAPVDFYNPPKMWDKKDQFWSKLVTATSNKWVIGAGTPNTPPGNIGVMGGHAYAVLGAYFYSERFPRVLHLFNPHHNDKYNGEIPNEEKSDGSFYVTLDEFITAFDTTFIGKVVSGAKVSHKVIQKDTNMALEFTMIGDDPFAVQLDWPSSRILKGCGSTSPKFKLLVAKAGDLPTTTEAMIRGGSSSARADMSGGSGKYYVFVRGTFPTVKVLNEMVVNIYGKEAPTIQVSWGYSNPKDLYFAMTGRSFSEYEMGHGYGYGLSLTAEKVENMNADTDIHELSGSSASAYSEEECGSAVARMKTLDDGEQIASTGYDSVFPEEASSISDGGACGDAAIGDSSDCNTYNHWLSIKRMKTLVTDLKNNLEGGCVQKAVFGDKCMVDTTLCQTRVKMECTTLVWTLPVGFHNSIETEACGNCKVVPA